MSKQIKIIIFITLILCISVLCFVVFQNNIRRHRQQEIEAEYMAMWNDIPNDRNYRNEYANYSVVDEHDLFIAISAYNTFTGNDLNLDTFKDFLSKEYNEDGSLRVENINDEISDYMKWYEASGQEVEVPQYDTELAEVYYEFTHEQNIDEVLFATLSVNQLAEMVKKEANPDYDIDKSLFDK